MATISVTPEELRTQAQVYITAKDEIEAAVQKVNSMNSTISSEWKGAAFEAYINQYNELHKNISQFGVLLEGINQQLNKYAEAVQDRDAQDAQNFGF